MPYPEQPVKGGREAVPLPRPLFERLCRGADCGYPSARVSPDRYASVIARDIESLFNTRSPQPWSAWRDDAPEGVIGYGLPDFGGLCPLSASDLRELESMITSALTRFEPRLGNVEVEAAPGRDSGRTVVFLRASLVVNGDDFSHEFVLEGSSHA